MRFLDRGGSEIDPGHALFRTAVDGVVWLRDANTTALLRWSREWLVVYRHPHADPSGLTLIAPRPESDDSAELPGFTSRELPLHTDRSAMDRPPAILANVLVSAPEQGGHAVLLDGRSMLRALTASRGDHDGLSEVMLRTHDGRRSRVFSFASGRCRIRYRDDRVASPNAPPILSRVVTDIRGYLADAGNSMRVVMNVGDGYMIHNHRYLHGRTPFRGDRQVARVLGYPRPDHLRMNRGFEEAGCG